MNDSENKLISISNTGPVFIIAEAGVNHNGDINLAFKLIDAAKEAGADAVKFQNFFADQLIRKDAPKAEYQNRNIGREKTQYQMLKELEISPEDTEMLKKYCDKKGIIFMSTAYDFSSFNLLEKIGIRIHKLASIDVVFHPMIEAMAKTKKPLILSTGMASEEEIKEATNTFINACGNKNNLILLQCNTNYPANPKDQNLFAMNVLKKYVPIIGFSDHTEGYEIASAAVALGAKVLERHFTLDKNMEGPDHKASMNPEEFHYFVKAVRKVELALGVETKNPAGGEIENITGMRRSICAGIHIPAGAVIKKEHLSYKRPGNGMLPTNSNINKILGKKAKKDISADKNLTIDLLE